jgi:hypothetical protein
MASRGGQQATGGSHGYQMEVTINKMIRDRAPVSMPSHDLLSGEVDGQCFRCDGATFKRLQVIPLILDR